MCVDHSQLLQHQNTGIMLFLLMTFLVNAGSSSCRKDQTFSNFCEFKTLVEKESGKQVKALRRDNGGEYISNEFKDFCSK